MNNTSNIMTHERIMAGEEYVSHADYIKLQKELEEAKEPFKIFYNERSKLEKERDEARDALKEWQTLCLWGGTPEHIHDFIKGQQTRIHEAQDIEKTCEQLERERDEAREDLEFRRGLYKVQKEYLEAARRDLAEAQIECLEQARLLSMSSERKAKLIYERDEARDLLASEKITRNHIIQRGIEMQKERDEAKEELSKLTKTHLSVALSERDDALNQIQGWENKWKASVEMAAIAENKASNLEDQLDLAMKTIKRLEANQP